MLYMDVQRRSLQEKRPELSPARAMAAAGRATATGERQLRRHRVRRVTTASHIECTSKNQSARPDGSLGNAFRKTVDCYRLVPNASPHGDANGPYVLTPVSSRSRANSFHVESRYTVGPSPAVAKTLRMCSGGIWCLLFCGFDRRVRGDIGCPSV